jgi:hypothetical protein
MRVDQRRAVMRFLRCCKMKKRVSGVRQRHKGRWPGGLGGDKGCRARTAAFSIRRRHAAERKPATFVTIVSSDGLFMTGGRQDAWIGSATGAHDVRLIYLTSPQEITARLAGLMWTLTDHPLPVNGPANDVLTTPIPFLPARMFGNG